MGMWCEITIDVGPVKNECLAAVIQAAHDNGKWEEVKIDSTGGFIRGRDSYSWSLIADDAWLRKINVAMVEANDGQPIPMKMWIYDIETPVETFAVE